MNELLAHLILALLLHWCCSEDTT